MTKLAEGKLDLHSKRGAVDLAALAARVAGAGGAPPLAEAIAGANSALHAFELAAAGGFDLPALIADGAWRDRRARPRRRANRTRNRGRRPRRADSREQRVPGGVERAPSPLRALREKVAGEAGRMSSHSLARTLMDEKAA